MNKILISCASLIIFSAAAAPVPSVTTFVCPSPDQVKCIPTDSVLMTPSGEWQANGGQMTGNTFAPDNQCANMIALPNSQTRLVCCYTKCGVFLLDVPYAQCIKQTRYRFICN
jgi:hypothetical protein